MNPATRRLRIVEIWAGRSAGHRGTSMATKGKSGNAAGEGTCEHPWTLKTPSGTSEFQAFRDEALDPPALVVKTGSTGLRYHLRGIKAVNQMLNSRVN